MKNTVTKLYLNQKQLASKFKFNSMFASIKRPFITANSKIINLKTNKFKLLKKNKKT